MEFRGYPVRTRHIRIGTLEIDLLGPDNYETLVDDPRVITRFSQDEYMPYWAEFWPACVLLAEAVYAWGPASPTAPLRVLEFGCGLGLASIVAAKLGYSVVASDYDDDALAFVDESARRNGCPRLETAWIDWRKDYPDRYDRLLAAEVLYEPRNLDPIARFLARHLAPNGSCLIADGRRQVAEGFPAAAAAHGLRIEERAAEAAGVSGRLFLAARA